MDQGHCSSGNALPNLSSSGNSRTKYTSPSERVMGRDTRRAMLREEQEMNDKTRIGFLNQCKMELSAEVIRWKEENLKLRKENEAAVKKIEELQSANNKLLRKNHELESNLFLSCEENKRLKIRTLAIGEENCALQEKLSKSKFHTYPCFEMRKQNTNTHSSRLNIIGNRKNSSSSSSSPPPECWEEVSKKLFQQMHEEMKEVQKLSLAVCEKRIGDNDNLDLQSQSALNDSTGDETNLKEISKAKRRICDLLSQSEGLKRHLKLQNEKLQFLLNNSNTGSNQVRMILSSDQEHQLKDHQNSAGDFNLNNSQCEEAFKRPSDETFRAYFTQQLTSNTNNNNNKNGEDVRKIMRTYFKEAEAKDDDSSSQNRTATASAVKVTATSNDKLSKKSENNSKQSNNADLEKKICPICQYIFSKSFPYNEFEAHVMAHLEDVSASLIDQYEVISQQNYKN